MERRLVIGDIHGSYRALEQVLERCEFDPENDFLFIIGDIVDGYPESKECVDKLMSIPHKIFVMGNHDYWFLDWMESGKVEDIWFTQGGESTLESFSHSFSKAHFEFFRNAVAAAMTEDKIVFVHGGFDPVIPIAVTPIKELMWDRDLWKRGYSHPLLKDYEHIYIGHTSTNDESLYPVTRGNVTNVDQGCGWGGRLTVMDIDSREYWSSDKSEDLYPEYDVRG